MGEGGKQKVAEVFNLMVAGSSPAANILNKLVLM